MATNLKIISLNIEFNKHLDLILPFFRKENADVLLLQEVLEENLEFLHKNLQMDYIFIPLCRVKFSDAVKTLGIATFSKIRIIKSKTLHFLGNPKKVPLIDRTEPEKMNRVILVTWISKNSQEFCLINTHFTWAPDGGPNFRQRVDLDKLLKLLIPLEKFVLAGDFNAPRGREIFDTLAKYYKDNIPQNVTTTIDKNLHVAGDLQLVIDGLFTTKSYNTENIRVVGGVSDHCAIIGTIYNVT